MVTRKSTPDILGDLLRGPAPPSAQLPACSISSVDHSSENLESEIAEVPCSETEEQEDKHEEIAETDVLEVDDNPEVVTDMAGVQDLEVCKDEAKEVVLTSNVSRIRAGMLQPNVAAWARNCLGAIRTTLDLQAAGFVISNPYSVDVYACCYTGQSGNRLDLWIECADRDESVNREDISSLVRKAVDVFYTAHAQKSDFWFDRLMLVSASSFDADALILADLYGVTCVRIDDTGYKIHTSENWQQKPEWLKDAQANLENLQG